MGRYTFKRAIQAAITILVLVTIIFILTRATGNPVTLFLPPDALEKDRLYMIHQLGLDKPYPIQYIEFVGKALKGDLGNSIRFQLPVTELYFQRFPNSLALAGVGFCFAVLIALPLGVIAASRRDSIFDRTAKLFSIIGMAAPDFWVALILIEIFAVMLGIFPTSRMGGVDHFILPGFSMALFLIAGMTRLLRSSMIDSLDSEYVKLAQIKGVSRGMVVWKHALRNSLIPVLTFSGMNIAILIGGTIVIETVFAWPGVGRLIYEGITNRDYPLVQGAVFFNGVFIVLINFGVDVIYTIVDPRIRRE